MDAVTSDLPWWPFYGLLIIIGTDAATVARADDDCSPESDHFYYGPVAVMPHGANSYCRLYEKEVISIDLNEIPVGEGAAGFAGTAKSFSTY